MNKYLFLTVLVGVLVGSYGCQRHAIPRQASAPTRPASARDSTESVRQLPKNTTVDSTRAALPTGTAEARAGVAEIDFRYLTAKSKISFKSQTQELDNASVNIRVREDSLIWVSISKLGIEGARILITRDSIMILDKINRAYSAADFATLSRQFNFDINFRMLQAVVVGNLPLPNRVAQQTESGQEYLLLSQREGPVLVENYIGKADHKLKKLSMTQQPANNTLRVAYSDFSSLSTFLFPFTSLLTLDSQSPTDGQVHQTVLRSTYSKVDLVDKNPGFPFAVPAGYQRRP